MIIIAWALMRKDSELKIQLNGDESMAFKVQKNVLHYYVDLLREKGWNETGGALHNVIRTMRISRHDKVCGEDFSHLDFGNIPLNGIHVSLDGEYPCDFTGCTLNEWNFMSGHAGSVCSVAWSPDGKYVLTGSGDTTAILWDANTGLMIRKLEGHPKRVHSVAFFPDGKRCLTESLAGAKIWDVHSGECLQTLEAMECVASVAFSPDGKRCLTGSYDNTAKIWDVVSGECLHTFRLPRENPGESLLWNLPYCCDEHNGALKVYKIDFENYANDGSTEYIDTFYDVDAIYLKQCVFRDISADETVRKILYQYGAELDMPH